jgi:membrane associated rhomboid family serine protease
MIPLKDSTRRQRFPFVNYAFIAANAFVFVLELLAGHTLTGYLPVFGVVPARVWALDLTGPMHIIFAAVPFVTCMFLHGGWLHLLGNMLYLWIFGDNVEDRLGHVGYVLFYFLVGFAATGMQVALDPSGTAPIIGASGAIAGVMGAYIVMYPRARILTLMPLIFYFWVTEVPVWFYLGFWFLLQLGSGLLELAGAQGAGVAWWAHVGGFAAGLFLVWFFPKRRALERKAGSP